MKKSLTALAVLGVFAGSAMAADVTLYGALDTGFEYFHKKTTKFDGSSEKSDTFDMQTLKTVESTLSQIRRRRARGTSGLWPSSP